MADRARDALDVTRYWFSGDYDENECNENMRPDPEMDYVKWSDHAAIVATLTARLAEEKKLSAAISRDCNECANQRNDALTRLAEAEGDARRYRWLLKGSKSKQELLAFVFSSRDPSGSIDAAIDAAMADSGGKV